MVRACFLTVRVGFASACKTRHMFITERVVRIRAHKTRPFLEHNALSCQEYYSRGDLACAGGRVGTFETISGKSIYFCNGYALYLRITTLLMMKSLLGIAMEHDSQCHRTHCCRNDRQNCRRYDSVKFFCNTTNHDRS